MDDIAGFFPQGRMISASKSGYVTAHPGHLVAFNANVCTASKGRIWCGDLDVTADRDRLTTLAVDLGEEVHVLRESAMHGTDVPDLGLAIAVVSAAGIKIAERA
jgi:hypothetical protein